MYALDAVIVNFFIAIKTHIYHAKPCVFAQKGGGAVA